MTAVAVVESSPQIEPGLSEFWVGAPRRPFLSQHLDQQMGACHVLGKALIGRAGLLRVLTIALLGGAIVNLALDGPSTVAVARTLPAAAWWHVSYLVAICTLAGYALWYVVISETDVNLAMMTIFIQPLAGVPIAAFLLGEPLHWGQLWGGLAILAGLALGLWQPKVKRNQEAR